MNSIILDDRNRQSWQSFYECKKSDGNPLCEVFITNYESLNKFFVKAVNKESKLTMKSIASISVSLCLGLLSLTNLINANQVKLNRANMLKVSAKVNVIIFALTGTPVVNNNNRLATTAKNIRSIRGLWRL